MTAAAEASVAPVDLVPRRASGLSTSIGLWLSGLVDVARNAASPPAARDRARTALREVARLGGLACEVVRVASRAEAAVRAAAARPAKCGQTQAVSS